MGATPNPAWHICGLLLVGIAIILQVAEGSPVNAEEKSSIFDFFFARHNVPPASHSSQRLDGGKGHGNDQQPRPTRQKPRRSVARKPARPEKFDNASRILVVGDGTAQALGEGLAAAFETTPGVVIDTRASLSVLATQAQFYNWPDMLRSYLFSLEPALVIFSLGDTQNGILPTGGDVESDQRLVAEGRRAGVFAAVIRRANVPLLWVGLPPAQSAASTADIAAVNAVFRTQMEKSGGNFIDVWDGFVGEDGKFAASGSDINGQPALLRSPDGFGLTEAGKRKLAFYAEKEIRKWLGAAALPVADRLKGSNDKTVLPPVAVEDITETQAIAIDDPDLDGGALLLGGPLAPTGNGKSLRDRLVEKGEVSPAPAGRIDDFRLAKPQTVLRNPVMRN